MPGRAMRIALFQSTHPHRVRREAIKPLAKAIMFQSTHPHRVRRSPHPWTCSASSFNPRTHIGCDLMIAGSAQKSNSFNPRTHIGCDTTRFSTLPVPLSFNPRTHIGCDRVQLRILESQCLFQSTHPHRVRPKHVHDWQYLTKFQSTHPHRVRHRSA